jgi:hypothetical protein
MGILANPNDPNYETDIKGSQMAADALGHKLVIANIRTESEIESAFVALVNRLAHCSSIPTRCIM